ncbi:hypothetical protein [Ornithinimicrobium kibberense]
MCTLSVAVPARAGRRWSPSGDGAVVPARSRFMRCASSSGTWRSCC